MSVLNALHTFSDALADNGIASGVTISITLPEAQFAAILAETGFVDTGSASFFKMSTEHATFIITSEDRKLKWVAPTRAPLAGKARGYECAECSAKPGSPTLCAACLRARSEASTLDGRALAVLRAVRDGSPLLPRLAAELAAQVLAEFETIRGPQNKSSQKAV